MSALSPANTLLLLYMTAAYAALLGMVQLIAANWIHRGWMAVELRRIA